MRYRKILEGAEAQDKGDRERPLCRTGNETQEHYSGPPEASMPSGHPFTHPLGEKEGSNLRVH